MTPKLAGLDTGKPVIINVPNKEAKYVTNTPKDAANKAHASQNIISSTVNTFCPLFSAKKNKTMASTTSKNS